MNFLIGAVAGSFATCIIQPIDYIKVQIQVRSELGIKGLSSFTVIKETIEKEGVKRFYTGLDSALLRQILYTSTRLGVFYGLHDMYNRQYHQKPPLYVNVLLSLTCGGVGAIVGNPADLALVRMQSDLHLPPDQRRNYHNVLEAIVRTIKEEGFFSLWRGSGPSIIRALVMNFDLFVPFEETKKALIPYVDNARMRSIYGALIAGFFASTMSLPFDNIKIKLQKMKQLPDGTFPYKGVFDGIRKTVKNEGTTRLWVGLSSYYWRISPHVILMFCTADFLRNLFGVQPPHHYVQADKK